MQSAFFVCRRAVDGDTAANRARTADKAVKRPQSLRRRIVRPGSLISAATPAMLRRRIAIRPTPAGR